MSEDQELQAKIAALSGRINSHKQSTPPFRGQTNPSRGSHSVRGYDSRISKRADYNQGYGRGSSPWISQRETTPGYSRGRGFHNSHTTHRNRTLVLNHSNNVAQNSAATEDITSSTSQPLSTIHNPASSAPQFVSKRDRHMQLINTAVYDKISSERSRSIERTAEEHRQRRNARERAKLGRHFDRMLGSSQTSSATHDLQPANHRGHTVSIDNVEFQLAQGGSKLLRVSSEFQPTKFTKCNSISYRIDDPSAARATPKQAQIAGVTFVRSKNGNMYRAGLVGSKTKQITKTSDPCPKFTSTGVCPKGPNCRHVHDPTKVAICKEFLQKGRCVAGDSCDLSHEPTAARVPACVHFLRGHCTNEECRYAHIRVNPGAPVCRAFATLGYCGKGDTCAEKHVFECPDYNNTGTCRNKKCRLPHIDRAGQIRKTAAAQAAAGKTQTDDSSDLTSDEEEYDEIDSEDVDSDTLEGDAGQGEEHSLSQQQDFVHL